jgi:hypothetical protein
MRHLPPLHSIVMSIVLSLSASCAFAHDAPPPAKQPDPKQVAEDIYKKCMSKAHQIREEQVCKARKPSIDDCVEKQTKAKDAKTAQTKCELLYVSQ